MRAFLISTIAIAVTAGVLQLFLPWWVIVPVAFTVAYLHSLRLFSAFASGFVSIFLLWVTYAFIQSSANEHLLAQKVATLFPLGGNVFALLAITGLIGGLVAGFAAMSGGAAKQLSNK